MFTSRNSNENCILLGMKVSWLTLLVTICTMPKHKCPDVNPRQRSPNLNQRAQSLRRHPLSSKQRLYDLRSAHFVVLNHIRADSLSTPPAKLNKLLCAAYILVCICKEGSTLAVSKDSSAPLLTPPETSASLNLQPIMCCRAQHVHEPCSLYISSSAEHLYTILLTIAPHEYSSHPARFVSNPSSSSFHHSHTMLKARRSLSNLNPAQYTFEMTRFSSRFEALLLHMLLGRLASAPISIALPQSSKLDQ
jgi:hypothetical protein